VFVDGCAADERHVDGKRFVENILLPVELDEPENILGRHIVHFSALDPGVDKGTQADFRQHAGLPAAMSRQRFIITPCGMQYASILLSSMSRQIPVKSRYAHPSTV
jgi:hypothetical protein